MIEYRYRAFISYSHSDEQWAAWLHKTLEKYKPPKHLIGEIGGLGPIPAKLSPIFRDREDLASATDLSEKIYDALEHSAALIVICSKKSAKSKYVNDEILQYKRLGNFHRIFCLIVDGEPWASQDPDTQADECFPKALRYRLGDDGELCDEFAEPIAADVRPGKDGKLNAKLKIIAGMLGLGLDALKQREAHRRHVRMMIITVSAIVGMVITTGLATAALIARAEAERQKVRAERETEIARQTTQFMVGLFEIAHPSESRGREITAVEILDKGAARIESELAGQPVIQSALMDTMGIAYTGLQVYDKAIPLLEDSLETRQQLQDDNQSDVAGSMNHLAEVLTLTADYDEAEQLYTDALEMRSDLRGKDNLKVAESLTGLSTVHTERGEYHDAEPLIREALEIRRNELGDRNILTLESMEDLALNLFDQGDLETPDSMLRQVLLARRELLGDPHPEIAHALNNLAWVISEQGDYDQALALFNEALDMKRELDGDESHEVATGMNNLASMLHDMERYDEAAAMYRDAIDMQVKVLGPQHPQVATTMNNLAFLYYDMGQAQRAIANAERSLEISRAAVGPSHPEIARTLSNIGYWLTQQQDYIQAEPYVRESLEMRREILGADHPDVSGSLISLATLLVATNQHEEAYEIATKAHDICVDHFGEDHWRTGAASSLRGAALLGQKRYEEAEPLLLAGYEALANDHGAIRSLVEDAREQLVALYVLLERPEDADRYREQATSEEEHH